jgi:hypothetical protein
MPKSDDKFQKWTYYPRTPILPLYLDVLQESINVVFHLNERSPSRDCAVFGPYDLIAD